ncbi:MAG: transposase, partial [Atribacterota bacterium]
FNQANLALAENLGYPFVIGCKLRTLKKSLQEDILSPEGFVEVSKGEETLLVKELPYQGKRLIVSFSEKRAENDRRQREEILDTLRAKLSEETLPVTKLLSSRGEKRYLSIEEKDGRCILNQKRIEEDAAFDGYHGIITSDPTRPAPEILAFYASRWQIEDSFRLNKHDLRIRPIYHFTERRIHAHIARCYCAYAIARQGEYRVKLQQKEAMTFARIKEVLSEVQSTFLKDEKTGCWYRLPVEMSEEAKKIYRAFGRKRSTTPVQLTSPRKPKIHFLV